MWRTTCPQTADKCANTISIHVPRVEDDKIKKNKIKENKISIHVPRVEDDGMEWYEEAQSEHISIHVPRVEDDLVRTAASFTLSNFNPRPPCGGRP